MIIAIIGGGAAGFFAAIRAKEVNPHAEVIIFEKAHKVLAKVSVTGGGRCNLTNSFASVTDLKQVYPRGNKLMRRLFCRFNYEDTCRWFQKRGVELVTQDDNCVFPRSQSAMTIVNCLMHEAMRLGVLIRTGHKLQSLKKKENGDLQLFFEAVNEVVDVQRVVLTTGGDNTSSFYTVLSDLGHSIVTPIPSLFTFNIPDISLRALMGTVVDGAGVSIVGEHFRCNGPLLITHWGMSGPAILRLSSYAARWINERQYCFSLSVNWAGLKNVSNVVQELGFISSAHSAKRVCNVRLEGIPQRLWLYLLQRAGVASERRWGDLGRKGINKLTEVITNDIYIVKGKSTWREEFVTCGGVSLKSIHPNTLESKCLNGLFFAGEVTDVDAVTGGFNLQAAWTMGYVAGEQAALF